MLSLPDSPQPDAPPPLPPPLRRIYAGAPLRSAVLAIPREQQFLLYTPVPLAAAPPISLFLAGAREGVALQVDDREEGARYRRWPGYLFLLVGRRVPPL